MDEKEFKEYIERIQYNEEFKKIAKKLRITDMAKENMYENVLRYMRGYCFRYSDDYKDKILNYDRFAKFMDSCLDEYKDGFSVSDNGIADMSKFNFLWQANVSDEIEGNFCEGWMVFPDGSCYLSKRTLGMNQCGSGIWPITCMYAPIIGSQIAKKLGVSSVDYFIGSYDMEKREYSRDRILTPNILDENEELIPVGIVEDIVRKGNYISDTIELIKNYLRVRKFSKEEIKEVENEFLRQEFVAKLIGLRDQKPENSPVIINYFDNRKHVKMAPMMDFDYSFHIAMDRTKLPVRKCDNEATDIKFFILQYAKNKEIYEFMKKSAETLDMNEIFSSIYEEKGLIEFRDELNCRYMVSYADFVNEKLNTVKETINEIEKSR